MMIRQPVILSANLPIKLEFPGHWPRCSTHSLLLSHGVDIIKWLLHLLPVFLLFYALDQPPPPPLSL